MTIQQSPVVILSTSGYEPRKALFVNGLFICGDDFGYDDKAEVITLRARVIAEAIGCEVVEIDTHHDIKEECLSETFVMKMSDWETVYEDLVKKEIMPNLPAIVEKRLCSFLYLNIYF